MHLGRLIQLHQLAKQMDRVLDGAEGVAQLMADGRRQLTEHSHSLLLDQLLLGLLELFRPFGDQFLETVSIPFELCFRRLPFADIAGQGEKKIGALEIKFDDVDIDREGAAVLAGMTAFN